MNSVTQLAGFSPTRLIIPTLLVVLAASISDGQVPGKNELGEKVADDKAAEVEVEGLTFREPFSGLSASEIESKLVVFLITDEDPFEWTKAKLDSADKNRLGGGPDVWCG